MWDFPVPARSDEDEVLPGGPDPLEAGEVVERRPRDRALGDQELIERLAHWEPAARSRARALDASREPSSASSHCAQQLVGRPALDLHRNKDLGRQPPDRGQLEPEQGRLEVGGERCRHGGAHETGSRAHAARGRTGTAGSGTTSRVPGSWCRGTPAPAARIERMSAARSAGTRVVSAPPWTGGSPSGASRSSATGRGGLSQLRTYWREPPPDGVRNRIVSQWPPRLSAMPNAALTRPRTAKKGTLLRSGSAPP